MISLSKKLKRVLSGTGCNDYCKSEGVCMPVTRRVPMSTPSGLPMMVSRTYCERR